MLILQLQDLVQIPQISVSAQRFYLPDCINRQLRGGRHVCESTFSREETTEGEEEESRTALENSCRRRRRETDGRILEVRGQTHFLSRGQSVQRLHQRHSNTYICTYTVCVCVHVRVLPADSWSVALAPAECVWVVVFLSEPSTFGLSPPAGGVESLRPAAPSAACWALIGCCPPPAADAPAPLITNSNENSVCVCKNYCPAVTSQVFWRVRLIWNDKPAPKRWWACPLSSSVIARSSSLSRVLRW